MTKRISIKELEPAAYKAMLELENYTSTLQVSPILKELIKIRASQINGCAYCIDMHTEEAMKGGESARRIFALAAWKESHLFTEEEKAALQLTEEVTMVSEYGITDATYQNAVNHFGAKVLAQLIMQIIVINSWNRIAVSSRSVYRE